MTHTDSDQRRELLLATAANVFAAKGFHPTTMRDLARATGMSLAGIYYYVRSKDELLYLVQHQCFTAVLRGADRVAEVHRDPAERLTALIEHHVGFFADHMDEMKVLSHEADSLSGDHCRVVGDLKRRYLDLMVDALGALDEAEGLRVPPRVAAFALFGMLNWIYTWYDPSGPVPLPALAEHFATIATHGIASSVEALRPGR